MIRVERNDKRYSVQICVYNYTEARFNQTVLVENVNTLELAEFLERSMVPLFYIASALNALKRQKYSTACFNSKRELFYVA